VPKILKAQNATVVSLLIDWDSMAFSVLRMRAASTDTHPSNPFWIGHHSALASPPFWSPLAWRRIRSLMVWLWTYDTGAEPQMRCDNCGCLCSKPLVLSAAKPSSVATDAETDKWQKCNDLCDNYYFQPVATETAGMYGKPTAPSLSWLAKRLVDMSGDPRE